MVGIRPTGGADDQFGRGEGALRGSDSAASGNAWVHALGKDLYQIEPGIHVHDEVE